MNIIQVSSHILVMCKDSYTLSPPHKPEHNIYMDLTPHTKAPSV